MSLRLLLSILPGVFVTAGLLGCNSYTTESASDDSASESPSVTPVVDVSPAALAQLAKADQLDGQADQVITRCYSCELGMDGHQEHAVTMGDYTAHFCSEYCQSHFVENAEDVVKNTSMPEEE